MMSQFNFVSSPPQCSQRLYCTMVCHSDDPHIARRRSVATSHFTRYTLYIEYLGGLVPILKGHRTNRLKPTFSISVAKRRPTRRKVCRKTKLTDSMRSHESLLSSDGTMSSGEEVETSNHSSSSSCLAEVVHIPVDNRVCPDDTQSLCDFTDPCSRTLVGDPLVVVTSNVACTKFKMQGLDPKVSQHLGSIVYKPSLLHLHPRKIAVLLPNPDHQLTGDFDQVAETTLELGDELEDDDDFGEKAIVSPTASLAHQYASRFTELGDAFRVQRSGMNHVLYDRNESEGQVLVMHNRTPIWNSQSQVYQLDFGGRVTQESAKNFQLELDGQQVGNVFIYVGITYYYLEIKKI